MLALGLLWSRLWKQDFRDYLPFLCAGMVPWVLVSTVVTEGCFAFTSYESIIKSMRFSFTVLTCAVVWRNLIVFFHNLLVFVVIAVICRVPVNQNTLLVVPGLLLFFVNAVWVTALLGLICTRFRDVAPLLASMLQIALFVTPIFWAPAQLGLELATFVKLNLIYHFVDAIRSPLLGRAPGMISYEAILLATVAGWAITLALFSRFERRIAYWL